MKSDGKAVLLGFKKETQTPLFLPDAQFDTLPDLNTIPDLTTLPNTNYFLKRKYLNNGSVKNFLSGSLAEQSDYFDELAHVAQYPEIFPCSLTSGGLMEKAQKVTGSIRFAAKRPSRLCIAHQVSHNSFSPETLCILLQAEMLCNPNGL